MNRNVESRFALAPSVNIGRSKFNRPFDHKTSFNVASIIPFYLDPVYPGDTFNVKTSKVIRLQTPLTPIMDNLYLDTYYFFVPNRLVWSHWKEFMGENTSSAWLPQTTYNEPQIEAPSGGWNIGTLADYFGIPTGVDDISVSALPFRAYALICNEFFRDQNLSDPLNIPMDETTIIGVNTGTFVTDVVKGGLPYTAAKYHDVFTSASRAPQKGPDVSIPVGVTQDLPVVVGDYVPSDLLKTDSSGNYYPLEFLSKGIPNPTDTYSSSNSTLSYKFVNSSVPIVSTNSIAPINLWAKQQGGVAAATINQLRMAFQIQKMYEKDTNGTRYIEVIRNHFGVNSPDARLQRPEYLGGNRVPITISQVIQNSETGTTPQGSVTGMSLTTDVNDDFIKSFTEHGYVIGLMVARYDHTYQQGIERFWSRLDRLDYYWPSLAHIGNQAIKNKEIYAQGSSAVNPVTGEPYDDEVFGYQEAWYDLRYKPSRVSGEMRSAATTSLDVWHLADDYQSMPYLGDTWIREDPTTVDRVLAVQSSVSNQLFADIYVQNVSTRPLPLYSLPGLIDHF